MTQHAGTRPAAGGGAPARSTAGPSRLEDVLRNDAHLLASLQQEERIRRRRRRWLFIGGMLMTAIIASVVTWITVLSLMGPLQDPKAVELADEGWRLWQAGDKVTAEARFEEAAKLAPTYVNAWNGLGWSRLNQGKSKEAADAFEQCVKLSPDHPAAHNGLGWIRFDEKRFDDAEKHWTRVANQAPASWSGLARLYLLKGDFEKALPWTEKSLNQQPGDPLLERMFEAAKSGKLEDNLRREIEPRKAAPNTQQGWLLFNRGQFEDAAKAFRAALKDNPDDPAAHNGLGFSLLNTGKPGEARPHFEAALKHWPDGGGPLNGLARCLKAEGNVEGAIEIWKRFAEQEPPNAGTVGLAETYLELGQYAEAVRYWRMVVQGDPSEHFRERLEAAQRGLAESRKP